MIEGKITRGMTVGEIVQQYPQTIEVMLKFGLHCVGCHVSTWETIEQGTVGHGMPKEVMEQMIKEMNRKIENSLPIANARKSENSLPLFKPQ